MLNRMFFKTSQILKTTFAKLADYLPFLTMLRNGGIRQASQTDVCSFDEFIGREKVTMANTNLSKAKTAKNDEFYTQYADIQNEINAYTAFDEHVFRNKTILLPCDDPEWSNFTRFFINNFERYGLKKLISTSYAPNSKPKEIIYQPTLFETIDPRFDKEKTRAKGKIFVLTQDKNKDGKIDEKDLSWDYLEGDGDFKSEEVKHLRDEADIIITNPPFSLFREFIAWLLESEKQFSIIGNKNAITYKEVFPLIMQNKMWVGKTPMSTDLLFNVPNDKELIKTKNIGSGYRIINGTVYARSQAIWYTNIEHGKRHAVLPLMTMEQNIKYSKHKEIRNIGYKKYDNYDAIEVPFVDAIPSDYKENMAVPITFLDKYCPDQFEIIDANTIRTNDSVPIKAHGLIKDKDATITEKIEKDGVTPLTNKNETIQSFRTEQNRTEQGQPMPELSSVTRCNGIMGVPISFLDKYCPDQFEIIGLDRYVDDNPNYGHRFTIDGREIYARILIRHKM